MLKSNETYVMEEDGSIHKMLFSGDADWEERATTSIQEIRNQAIDEFAHRIRSKVMAEIDDCADELDWIDEIADQMKAGAV